jgi:hypothetical protein
MRSRAPIVTGGGSASIAQFGGGGAEMCSVFGKWNKFPEWASSMPILRAILRGIFAGFRDWG